jgi:5-methylthioadenosine/S-adenosylhomocysteine deaminase
MGRPLSAPFAIVNAEVLEGWDAQPRPGAVLIEGERIAGVAYDDDAPRLAARAASTHDARGALVTPAFVNAHHHSYANILRGTENSYPLELWALFTVAHGRAIDAPMLRLGILLGAAEMLRAGIAAVIDHTPQVRRDREGFAAHIESGMRVGYAPMINDLHDHDLLGFTLPAELRARLGGPGFASVTFFREMFAELAAMSRASDGRVQAMLGPNAPQRCSDALLDLWHELRARHDLHVHTHLLETRVQAIAGRRRWPHGIVRELDRRGLLDRRLAVAHGVWLDEDERALLAARGVTVVHNPASNLMLGSGAMALDSYRSFATSLALGSDSANTGGAANPFELMRLAMMLPRLVERDWRRWPGAREVFRMATEGGAAALGLGGELGRIVRGRLADIAIVALDDSSMLATRPSLDVLVQHGAPARVLATLVGGRFAFREGRVLAFDEAEVCAAFSAGGEALRARADGDLQLAREAMTVLAPQLASLQSVSG